MLVYLAISERCTRILKRFKYIRTNDGRERTTDAHAVNKRKKFMDKMLLIYIGI